MKFDIPRKENPNIRHYPKEELDIVYKFAKEIKTEIGDLVKAIALFGSTSRNVKRTEKSDIDVLIIVDDLSIALTQEVVEAYRIIVQKIIAKVSIRLHVISLRLTTFWEYVRNGDPVGINILRDGVAIIDTGFFDPLQSLLKRGRIRPSEESIWTYFVRAPRTLQNSKWHILQATLDLYWAVIDAAHAALMRLGEIPPTPAHVADMINDKLVKKKLLEPHYVTIMNNFYRLMKMITYSEIREVKGHEFDRYYVEADKFVERMRKFIEVKKHHSK